MPAKSEAQRKFIYATKGPAFAKAHHFDNKGPLPEKLKAGTTNVGLALFKAMQSKTKNRNASRT